MAGLLDVHGFIDPVIARRSDGLLIGGHQRLRANALRESPDQLVPCVFLEEMSDVQAKALNIALNNHEAQGEYDEHKLAGLLAEIQAEQLPAARFTGFDDERIEQLLGESAGEFPDPPEVDIPESFEVAIQCDSESHQKQLYDRLTREGLKCRLLML